MKPINTDHEVNQGRIQVDHNENKRKINKTPYSLSDFAGFAL